MKRFTKWLCLLLLTTALLMPHYANAARGIAVKPVSPSGAKVKGNQWLFVIGIDTYIHWPRLKTAVSDAKSVRDVLLSRYHFDKDQLIELYDEQATRRNILGKLRFLAKKVRKDDSLVIFYAGHGHLDSITKAGSWIPVGSGVEDTSAWITNHDIKNYLRVDAIKAKHILLVSDSCFSGDFFRGHRGKLPEITDTVIKKAYKLTSRQAITSGGLEPVGDEGFGKNSVFSHFLVKTLKENQKPFLVPSSFFPDIKSGVAENAEQFPRFGSLKDTGGQQGGEIILFLKQDMRLKGLSQEAAESQKELERLRTLEKTNREAKEREAAAIAKGERELAKLHDQIMEMRKRLGTSAVRTDDTLDTMLVIVEKKEAQERQIDELKKQRKAEEEKRQTEIARLKKEQKEKKIATLEKEIEKFKKIISSKFGKDMKASAWKSLAARYPEAADAVKEGNTECLLYKFINPSRFITESSGVVYDKKTGLEWTTMRYKVSTWKYARNWVADLQVAGGRWRLPSVSELKSIYHKSATQCNWPPLFETNEGLVWSSETLSKREPRMLSKEESAGWKRGMATPMKTEWYAKAVDFYNSGIVKKTYQTRHARIFAVRSRR